jgi:hypothetical protein
MKNYELMYNIAANGFFRELTIFYELAKVFRAKRTTRKQIESFKEDWDRLIKDKRLWKREPEEISPNCKEIFKHMSEVCRSLIKRS